MVTKKTKKTTKKTSKKSTGKGKSKASPKKMASGKKAKTTIKKAATKKTVAKRVFSKPKVHVGEPIASLVAPATNGKTFDLNEHKGKTVVLYFYPKDNTPGCTLEGQDFTKLHPEFQSSGVEVYGISRDTLQSHESFKGKMCFPFELLSDTDEKLCKEFGVIKEKNMYGKKVIGVERSTFVIDRDGVLRREWRGVKVPNHAQEVLEYVKSLS